MIIFASSAKPIGSLLSKALEACSALQEFFHLLRTIFSVLRKQVAACITMIANLFRA